MKEKSLSNQKSILNFKNKNVNFEINILDHSYINHQGWRQSVKVKRFVLHVCSRDKQKYNVTTESDEKLREFERRCLRIVLSPLNKFVNLISSTFAYQIYERQTAWKVGREIECACVCVCVCVCVWEIDKEREWKREREWERVYANVRACVCVWEIDRERESEIEGVCVWRERGKKAWGVCIVFLCHFHAMN